MTFLVEESSPVLTLEQLRDLWESYEWRLQVEFTLRDVLWAPDTSVDDRLAALNLLNQGMASGIFPRDLAISDDTCVVLILITNGSFEIAWWRRIGHKRRQRRLHDRLHGARVAMATASQFLTQLQFQSNNKVLQSELLAS